MKLVRFEPYALAAFTLKLSRPQQCLNPLGLVLRCLKAVQYESAYRETLVFCLHIYELALLLVVVYPNMY